MFQIQMKIWNKFCFKSDYDDDDDGDDSDDDGGDGCNNENGQTATMM